MATDFQKYQAGKSILDELDTLLDVDDKGYSRALDANINDAKMVLSVALQEICKRAESHSKAAPANAKTRSKTSGAKRAGSKGTT